MNKIHTREDIVRFDVQSPSNIDAAAVVWHIQVDGYFETSQLVKIEIQDLYDKDGKQMHTISRLQEDDYPAISDFLFGLRLEYNSREQDWLREMKEEFVGK